ncbi:MAG: hypothetical protein V9H26_13985 [Verrucomicrobiota bacterium]
MSSTGAKPRWPPVFRKSSAWTKYFPDNASATNADRHRREYTWPIYLSGGQLEYILEDLIKTDDFRKYEPVWNYTWYARKFLEENHAVLGNGTDG